MRGESLTLNVFMARGVFDVRPEEIKQPVKFVFDFFAFGVVRLGSNVILDIFNLIG